MGASTREHIDQRTARGRRQRGRNSAAGSRSSSASVPGSGHGSARSRSDDQVAPSADIVRMIRTGSCE